MVGALRFKETERLLKKVKTKYWSVTHKYGLELPKSVAQALAIDKRTGTDFWEKAIEKEIRNVFPAFEFLKTDDAQVPPGFQFVETYFVFDIKMDLTRKARLVARGSMTEATKEETFASVNAYLAAPNKEKVWTKFTDQLGPEYNGKKAIIAKALYGLRSSGRSFRDYLAMNLRELGFISSKADPDLWMRSAKKSNGDHIYEYVISYVDDLVFQGIDPNVFMDALGKRFTLKPGSIKEPDTYLGANVKKFRIPNSDDPDKVRWAFESSSYVAKAIKDVERELSEADMRLMPNVRTPLASGYRPDLDLSPELGSKQLNYFQGLIGILRWICELGRIDILMPVSILSRYLVSARQGHLEQAFHIFAYLKTHSRSTMVFDDTVPTYRSKRFVKCDWSEFYPDAAEAIPTNMPQPRGKSGGYEFTAGVDPEEKHAAINFHRVREAIAAGTIKIAKEDTRSNLADILTKLMPGPKMKELLANLLW
ncbi:Reverse transcriptase (RNA-dependent DNA polymerase) [Fragilaria crotonensis]|nr:Reverse transcriptase (RNA-dependent DNA polymerase) [Fragilaria crotonensis]